MKLAILGSGPLALEAALEFHHHGAAVTCFNAPEIEPESFFERDYSDCVGPFKKSFPNILYDFKNIKHRIFIGQTMAKYLRK